MTEEQPQYDTDALRDLHNADQRSAADKERDQAIYRGVGYTAGHYLMLKKQGLPDHLVEALTTQFHAAYYESLFNPVVSFQVVEADE